MPDTSKPDILVFPLIQALELFVRDPPSNPYQDGYFDALIEIARTAGYGDHPVVRYLTQKEDLILET